MSDSRRKLTPGQRKVYDYIVENIQQTQRPPTLRQIAKHFHWSGPNAAKSHIKNLVRHGYLECAKGLARGLRVVNDKRLTVDGTVSAGALEPCKMEPQGHLDLATWFDGNHFALHVDDFSLPDMRPGDLVIAKRDAKGAFQATGMIRLIK